MRYAVPVTLRPDGLQARWDHAHRRTAQGKGASTLRRFISLFFGALLLVAIGWSLWWYLAAEAERRGVETWLAKQRERGWQAEAQSIEVTGFPMALRLAIDRLALTDPRNGWSWQAPNLLIESRPWEPTRAEINWPARHRLATPGEQVAISTETMESLLDLRPGTALELRQATTEFSGLVLESSAGWAASARSAEVRIAERSEERAPANSYDLRLSAAEVSLPEWLVARLDPTGWLESRVDRVTVIGHAALAEPIGLATVETGRIALRAATLREVGFEWGHMELVASGSFTVDHEGYPDGQIRVEAREWRRMVRLAVTSGLIGEDTANAVTKGIEILTMLTGGGDSLSAPFNLSGGKLRIGPVAVADLPRLGRPDR